MPCNSDPRNWNGNSEPSTNFKVLPPNVDNVTKDNLLDKIQLRELKDKNKVLEAALCAIFNELENKNIDKEILTNGSKNGKIDLFKFWEQHKQKDVERLQKELDKFSEHEKQILKKLLK